MPTGRIPYAGRSINSTAYDRTLLEMMQRQSEQDQQYRREERQRQQEQWGQLASLPARLYETYRGVKDQQLADQRAKAQAQAVQDRERLQLYAGLPQSVVERLPGVTTPSVEARSARVGESSYTPEFQAIAAGRVAQADQPPAGTLTEMMQRGDQQRLVDPAVGLPRPDPRLLMPTLTLGAGHPDIPPLEVPFETAEIQQQMATEKLAADAELARQKADAERRSSREETLFEKSLEPEEVDDTNIFYSHEGRILPLILRETTSFNPKTQRYESETTLLTAPDGQLVRHQDEDAVEWVNAGVNTVTGNSLVRNPRTNELKELPNVTTSSIFEKGLEKPLEVKNYSQIIEEISDDPGINEWGLSPIEALGTPSEGGVFNKKFSQYYLTGPFSGVLKSWAKFFGAAEKSRSAQERINYANMMTLSALADNERMSETEKMRIKEYVTGMQGSFGKGATAVRDSITGLGILLDEIIKTHGRNLDFTDRDEVQSFQNDASRIRLIQRLLGLESSVFDGKEGVPSDSGESSFNPDF
jgi:hypothetical protein